MKKKRKPTKYGVTVKLTNGCTKKFRLSNDVQNAIAMERKFNPNFNPTSLKNKLIVVPYSSIYLNNQNPPLGVGKIIEVFKLKKSKFIRSVARSQFIKQSDKSYKDAVTYLQHDYSNIDKRQIKADLDFWYNKKQHGVITEFRNTRVALLRLKYTINHLKKTSPKG